MRKTMPTILTKTLICSIQWFSMICSTIILALILLPKWTLGVLTVILSRFAGWVGNDN